VTLDAQVAEVLDSVIDPCSAVAGAPAGLADMGLVKRVEIAPEGDKAHVAVVLRLTHPTCIMGPLFIESVEQGLLALDAVESAEVTLDADYSWTEEDMSPDYRRRLSAHRAEVLRRT
jgi:metal-sulfur cluster biosynthetic enzyme